MVTLHWSCSISFIVSAGLMSWVAYANERKKLNNENAEEERQKREDHYKKMEELLEKMSKEKETE